MWIDSHYYHCFTVFSTRWHFLHKTTTTIRKPVVDSIQLGTKEFHHVRTRSIAYCKKISHSCKSITTTSVQSGVWSLMDWTIKQGKAINESDAPKFCRHQTVQELIMDYNLVILCLVLLISVGWCQEIKDEPWTRSTRLQLASSDQCPPWHFYNATSSQCECFSSPNTNNIIKCTKHGTLLRFGHCMTYEEGKGFFVGLCNYFKVNSYKLSSKGKYIILPNNVSELNDYMCRPLNRKGVLCSECKAGFGPSITSIGHTCSNCTDSWHGVLLYLFLEFVPITVFYFIVLFFRINVTSAPMIAFVFYCQIGVSTFIIMSNRYLFDTTITYKFLNILITFYGIWNLDFFRYIIPPFCTSPYLKPIHINFLYYISAFYPLCLIAITWICIELHSRHFKPTVRLWGKLNGCFHKMNTKWDAKNTMIDVFATFFLLSYAKLVFTCFKTISYGITINANNFSEHKTYHVKTDASVKYFGTEHLPFAIASALILLLVVLPLPLLLAFYPIRAFRSLLFKCRLGNRTRAALNIFVEKFYSSCRDSLDGGRDMRSFICIHFVLRFIINYFSVDEILVNLSFTVIIFLYIITTVLFAIFQPYKKTYMNVTEILIFANLALLSLVLDKYSNISNTSTAFFEISGSILSTIPLLGLTAVMICRILRELTMKLPRCTRLLNLKNGTGVEDTEASQKGMLDTFDDSELPDRMLHPEHYVGESSYGSAEQSTSNLLAVKDYGSIE